MFCFYLASAIIHQLRYTNDFFSVHFHLHLELIRCLSLFRFLLIFHGFTLQPCFEWYVTMNWREMEKDERERENVVACQGLLAQRVQRERNPRTLSHSLWSPLRRAATFMRHFELPSLRHGNVCVSNARPYIFITLHSRLCSLARAFLSPFPLRHSLIYEKALKIMARFRVILIFALCCFSLASHSSQCFAAEYSYCRCRCCCCSSCIS